MENILDGLNAAQRAAVTSPSRVLQVLAPPGSGKTKTLTARVAYLLAHHGYAPWDIICCTFTIKASREMRERLSSIVGDQTQSKLILGTFHSICNRYLQRYGYLIGIRKGFGIADSSSSLSIIKRIIKRLNLGIDARAAQSRISRRKARGLGNSELSKAAKKSVEQQVFTTVCEEYEAALLASNLLDYDDLLLRCADLLGAYPDCVSNIQAVLIDEFQDTNVVQFELMKLLASKRKNITIVGDPDQSIYGFRSAEIENLNRMRLWYPGTAVINLEENYRSSAAVLRMAQAIIDQDTSRPDKRLQATHCHGSLPVLRKLASAYEEANWLVSEIRRCMATTGKLVDFSDFAILLRSAHLSRLIEGALGKAGIPYRMVGGHRFFDREEIRILLDYMRTISQPDNNTAFASIINVPSRKIGEETLGEFLRYSDENKISLWAVVQGVSGSRITLQKRVSKVVMQNLEKLIGIILGAKKKMESIRPDDAPKELLKFIIQKISFKDHLRTKHAEDHENRWANVEELLRTASDIADSQALTVSTSFDEDLPKVEGIDQQQLEGSEAVLTQFLTSINLSADVQFTDEEQQPQCVTISTIHAAKGLEWPVVFIPAVYEGSIPHSRAEDHDEERRLLYVAMTRAQALLYLSVPLRQSRDNAESTPSQYLPPDLSRRFAKTGPQINDRVVQDIAAILRRPMPLQENIIHCIQNLSEKESVEDDVWPADGSPRVRDYCSAGLYNLEEDGSITRSDKMSVRETNNTPRPGVEWVTIAGEQVRVSTTYNQTRKFSTTITTPSSFSASNTSLGFTTAKDQLMSIPTSLQMQSYLDTHKPTLLAYDGNKANIKKDVNSQNQGKLTTFLAKERFGSTPSQLSESFNEPASPPKAHTDLPSLPKIVHPKRNLPKQIPEELASHKIPCKSVSLKRPRAVLGETFASNVRRYPFLSSSPTRDLDPSPDEADPSGEDFKDQADKHDFEDMPTVPSKKVTPNTAPSTNTVPRFYNTASHMHTTSMASMTSMTTMDSLKVAGPARRTLGLRRTMNGWDKRMNK